MNFVLTCTALVGRNKAGRLPCDQDGWYTVVLGAVDYKNSIGIPYTRGSAEAHLSEGSAFHRRITSGKCFGEEGHPKRTAQMSDEEWFERLMTIEETRHTHLLRKIWIDDKSVKDKHGRPVAVFMGELKPHGYYGPSHKLLLDDPHANVSYSLRSIAAESGYGANKIRKILELSTFDRVTEPGIDLATKYNAPGLEGLTMPKAGDIIQETFSMTQLETIAKRQHQMGLENNSIAAEIYQLARSQVNLISTEFKKSNTAYW